MPCKVQQNPEVPMPAPGGGQFFGVCIVSWRCSFPNTVTLGVFPLCCPAFFSMAAEHLRYVSFTIDVCCGVGDLGRFLGSFSFHPPHSMYLFPFPFDFSTLSICPSLEYQSGIGCCRKAMKITAVHSPPPSPANVCSLRGDPKASQRVRTERVLRSQRTRIQWVRWALITQMIGCEAD